MSSKVLWIGLGNMGRGMCRNIVTKSTIPPPLMVYNRTTSRSQDLAQSVGEEMIQVVETLNAEAIQKADIIFTCLSNDSAVEDTLNTIIKAVPDLSGKLFVDSSTIHPDTTTKLSELATKAGGAFLAAPVFGGPHMADAGTLIGVLAGPKSAIERAKPLFKGVMSRTDIIMADQPPSKATTLKIIGNTFVLNLVEQLAEGHVLAEKTGLGTEHLDRLMQELFPGIISGYSGRMVAGDYYKRDEPAFAVDLARKDAGHAMDLARKSGTRMLNVETADRHLEKVKEVKGEKGDLPGIYGVVRMEAGLKFENDA
jgi:3-hydroxyisobutyrate dehydrogenase-like beta-hydroxyacid dehydrogenase